MTEHQAVTIVAMIANRYPGASITEETQEIWARVIEDLDYAATVGVVEKWMRSQPERPDPAEIRRLVAEAQAPKDTFPDAGKAWEYVQRMFTRVGSYGPFPTRYPVIAEAVAALGWQTLCASDNPEADRAHFFRVYRDITERVLRDSAVTSGAAPQLPQMRARLERQRGGQIGEIE